MTKKLKRFYSYAKQLYKNEPTGHDFSHIKRCLKNAKKIQKVEGGDKFILFVAVLFHDVHRVLSTKEKYMSAEQSIPFVKAMLRQFKLNAEDEKKILYLIKNHDIKESTKQMPIELTILHDVDILDAGGKRGLKRTKTFCINRQIPFYDGRYPLDVEDYIPNIKPYSTTHFVYRTMLPELQLIETETGKKLAKRKAKPLEKFIFENCKKAGYAKNKAK